MALIKCRECSAEISDSAVSCPRCGYSVPAPNCSISFLRSGLKNSAVRVELFVDGRPYGALSRKNAVTVPVSAGNHHVELKTAQGKSTVGTISASAGNRTFTVTMTYLGKPQME